MRCHYDKSMFPEVRRAVQLYIRWLKRHYYLGDKISLYLINKYRIKCLMDNDYAFGTTFFPDDGSEIIIRIACGCKAEPVTVDEWDNYIGGVLSSLTHELTHVLYDPVETEYSERSLEWHCTRDANEILNQYARTHKHLV
ncbi:MAG: hypothetical protein IJ386_04065 [Clostridia bacterium]|nr:hypothetical protein [Clostridia bacterium]